VAVFYVQRGVMKSEAPARGRQNAVPFLKTPAVYTATQRKGSREKVIVLANPEMAALLTTLARKSQ
jgi:hypothetical protein